MLEPPVRYPQYGKKEPQTEIVSWHKMKVLDGSCFMSHNIGLLVLNQGCQRYGPRAGSGPPAGFIRPPRCFGLKGKGRELLLGGPR